MKHGKCKDCGVNTYIDSKDYYMVTCEIWNKYGLGGSYYTEKGWASKYKNGGMLCMRCLETRMGRKLQRSDLMQDAMCNFVNPYTNRLLVSYKKQNDNI